MPELKMPQLKARNHRFTRPREAVGVTEHAQPQPLLSARVEPEMKERVEEWAKRANWTKRQAMEYAFELLMENVTPQKARMLEPQ